MRQCSLYGLFSVFFCALAAQPAERAQAWPIVTAHTPEEAIQSADGAFLGRLDLFDVDSVDEQRFEASGRIIPEQANWGDLPGDAMELGRRFWLARGGGGNGPGPQPWDFLGWSVSEGRRSFPLIIIFKGEGDNLEFLHVVFRDPEAESPAVEDLLLLRELEFEADTPQLRDRLIDAVIAPESSRLLWSYALRRLYRLEDDPVRRFHLVLDKRIQKTAPLGHLYYARDLLTGQVRMVARPTPSSEEARTVLGQFLKSFETTDSSSMVVLTLSSFRSNAERRAQFTELEWDDIRARVRAVLNNPEHVIHKLDDAGRRQANNVLERLLGEPDLLSPEP